jgi:hypothetical protein
MIFFFKPTNTRVEKEDFEVNQSVYVTLAYKTQLATPNGVQ